MDAEQCRTLLSQNGLSLLDEVTARREELTDPVAAVQRLRAEGHDPALVAVVLAQARLRERAAAKFGPFAASMLFTEAGLEQATRLSIAAHHAGRFLRAGLGSVADLGCGIGADSLAFAAVGLRVHAVERDEVTAAIATFNLAAMPNARVELGDAEAASLDGVDAAWLDPARRNDKRRLADPGDWSPSLDVAFAIAAARPSGIKLSPAIDRALLPSGVETQWIGEGRETLEAVVWSRELARDGVASSALVLHEDGAAELVGGVEDDPELRELGEWLYEPDGAVIRAQLIGKLARELGAGAISERIAYLTADEPHETRFAQRFRVLEVVSMHAKDVSSALAARGVGQVEIKKRGTDIDPAQFRKRLALAGEREATVLLTRIEGRHRAIIAERA